MKLNIGQILLMVLLINGCSLAENRKPEEGKDYQGEYIPDAVEYHDLATVQRLEDFYSTDPIDYTYLRTIYKGNVKSRSDKSLKIHWEQARELALTEWEFQKEERA